MSAARLDFRTVAEHARGQWPAILARLGIDAACLRDRHGPCPGCGGTDRFRFDDRDGRGTFVCSGGGELRTGDGFALLEHVHGWAPGEALRAVTEVLGLVDRRHAPLPRCGRPLAERQHQPDPARQVAKLKRLWSAALPLDHTDAEVGRAYLRARALGPLLERGDWPTDLRLHPALDYWHTSGDAPVRIATLPALLAVVRRLDGHPVALHRTWLARDGSGKATLSGPAGAALPAKKLTPPVTPGATRGAAIRLYGAAARLAVGEGLETCLAVRVGCPSLPVWSCVSAGGLAALELPADVCELIVAADADSTGVTAARWLAKRLLRQRRGVLVRLALPPGGAGDWNDAVRATR